MFGFIKALVGVSESKYLDISDEKIESLNKAEVAFFASLREDSECFRDLIIMSDSPIVLGLIEERLDKVIGDYNFFIGH
ncbi:hypothetical protein [Streptococcus thoraltensis]|uniref:hypothetical protein n=1 Tax=Streptococcus thoraltensis TaxID=55085 RepID=UPI001F5AEA17|nr:hypothetical protein [Streptococcus thoraltensis]